MEGENMFYYFFLFPTTTQVCQVLTYNKCVIISYCLGASDQGIGYLIL